MCTKYQPLGQCLRLRVSTGLCPWSMLRTTCGPCTVNVRHCGTATHITSPLDTLGNSASSTRSKLRRHVLRPRVRDLLRDRTRGSIKQVGRRTTRLSAQPHLKNKHLCVCVCALVRATRNSQDYPRECHNRPGETLSARRIAHVCFDIRTSVMQLSAEMFPLPPKVERVVLRKWVFMFDRRSCKSPWKCFLAFPE